MEALRLPSSEEMHSAYVEGEKVVVALMAGLAANWVNVVQEQEETTQALTMRIRGSFPRAVTISSPASTRWIKRDRWVLAS